MTRRTPRKVPWKPAAKIVIVCVAFAVASVALAVLLSLIPGSSTLSPLVTLGLPLALAWLVAAGVGTNIVSKKHSLALATVCLLVATPAAYVLRGQPSHDTVTPGGDNAQAGEVLFRYEASFTYLSSEENLPMVDYSVQFPCPTVDGEPAVKRENLRWQLWGPVEGENGARWLELEVDNNNVLRWVGRRASSPPDNNFYLSPLGEPFHLISGGMNRWDNTITWKIGLAFYLDNMYVGEMLKSKYQFTLPIELENEVTLRENDGRIISALAWRNGVLEVWDGPQEDLMLKLSASFSVRLWKHIGDDFVIVEEFNKTVENVKSGYRYPISLL